MIDHTTQECKDKFVHKRFQLWQANKKTGKKSIMKSLAIVGVNKLVQSAVNSNFIWNNAVVSVPKNKSQIDKEYDPLSTHNYLKNWNGMSSDTKLHFMKHKTFFKRDIKNYIVLNRYAV